MLIEISERMFWFGFVVLTNDSKNDSNIVDNKMYGLNPAYRDLSLS